MEKSNKQSDKTKKFIVKSINKWGYRYNYNLVEYVDARTPVIITYKGVDFKQTPSKHLSGKLCELSENTLSRQEFIKRCEIVWGNRFNYDQTVYINLYSDIKIFDNENDIFIYQKAYSHMNGHKYSLNNDNFVFLANIIYDYKYDYNSIIKNITDKININCIEHGEFITRAYDHLNLRNSGMCPKCHFTKFNRDVTKYLDKNDILYHKQYKFLDCRDTYLLPFDFYIPSLRTVIEFCDSLENNIKNNYCEDNYIDMIYIKYEQLDIIEQYLKDILKYKI